MFVGDCLITQKFAEKRKTLVNVLSGGIWRCLKRERDVGTKATFSDVLQVKSRVNTSDSIKLSIITCLAFLNRMIRIALTACKNN